jgi:hypothetical protein
LINSKVMKSKSSASEITSVNRLGKNARYVVNVTTGFLKSRGQRGHPLAMRSTRHPSPLGLNFL